MTFYSSQQEQDLTLRSPRAAGFVVMKIGGTTLHHLPIYLVLGSPNHSFPISPKPKPFKMEASYSHIPMTYCPKYSYIPIVTFS